ncbi:MAG: TIGR02147 family protein [Deltaproteobacteria bacterium]|nr:TIGR02147 family protein [Deltaproteobacteria bacterium]
MISVFDFTNYRRFLRQRFSELKKKNPLFSFRSFNRLAGLSSSGFLKLVMDGKRNLAEAGIEKIARGFKLNESEKKYFRALVRFNQAKTNEEKNQRFLELSRNKKFLAAKPLTSAQYRLFSHWYYVAMLELVRLDAGEKRDLAWLHARMNPQVEWKSIKQAAEELKKLGLLEESAAGYLGRLEAMLTTPDEVQSLSVANFHQQMCRLAARAVMQEDSSDREFSALTIASSEKSFQKAKQEIQKFRKKLHSILEQDREAPRTFVAQINLQLFKLSHPVKS